VAAIDLLFDVKPHNERMHQLALGPLLIRTSLLERLVGVALHPGIDFDWEPRGGLFDLSVKLEDGRTAWVEIKIDSLLEEGQIARQLATLREGTATQDFVIYLLLGLSHIAFNPKVLARCVEAAKVNPEVVHRFVAPTLIDTLADPSIIPGRGAQHRDARDLAVAYRELLVALQQRCTEFEQKPVADWEAGDFYGFFALCREHIPEMSECGIGYEANRGGGFFSCGWAGWVLEEGVGIYLLFENNRLCVKVGVRDVARRGAVRDQLSERVLAIGARSSLTLQRPGRMGVGENMTVAVVCDLPFGRRDDLKEIAAAVTAVSAALEEVRRGWRS
jgi:hypothetical protein